MSRAQALSRIVKKNAGIYAFLLPSLILMILFIFYPIGSVFYLAFTQATLVGRPVFNGIENFQRLFSSEVFRQVLGNSFVFMVACVSLKMLLGLAAALLLNRPFKGRRFIRMLILIPWATPRVVGGYAWQWIFNGLYGMLNDILYRLGIIDQYVTWLAYPASAMAAVVIADVWLGLPFATLTYLAGFQTIPTELYQAGTVDGASKLQQFYCITIPLLRPVILVLLVIMSIWTFNSFDLIWTITRGGPLRATDILVTEAYKSAFTTLEFGYASAIAVFIFVLLMALSIVYLRLMREDA